MQSYHTVLTLEDKLKWSEHNHYRTLSISSNMMKCVCKSFYVLCVCDKKFSFSDHDLPF